MLRLLVILVMIGALTANTRAQDMGTFIEIERIGRGEINEIFWSPDSQTVAVTTSRGIWFYQADDLTLPPRWIEMDSTPVIAFDPMWQNMAIAEDGGIWIYDVATGERTVPLKSGYTVYRALAFSTDGKQLAGAVDTDFAPTRNVREDEGESFIHVWSVISQEQLDMMESYTPLRVYLNPELLPPRAMAFSPDGTKLGVSAQYWGGDYGLWQFFLLDLESGEVLTSTDYRDGFTNDYVLDDARVLISAHPERDIVVFDPAPEQVGIEILGRDTNLEVLQISPDAQQFIVDVEGELLIQDAEGKTIVRVTSGVNENSQFSPDGKLLAVHDGGRLGILNIGSIQAGGRGCGDGSPTACLTYTDAHVIPEFGDFDPFLNSTNQPLAPGQAVSGDGQWMVSSNYEDEYGPYLIHLADNKALKLEIDEVNNQVVDTRFSPDNTLAAVAFTTTAHGGSFDHFLRVWDVSDESPDAQPIVQLEHPGPLRTLTFSPDGLLLATVSENNVFVWDVATWTLIDTVEHPVDVETLTFSVEGEILTTATEDGIIRLWRR